MTTAGASWNIVLRLGAAIVVASVLVATALAAHERVAFERALVPDDSSFATRHLSTSHVVHDVAESPVVEEDSSANDTDVRVGSTDDAAAETSSSGTARACALHVFRHASKTGGTTMRFIFDRQTVLGAWEAPVPYGASEMEWKAFKEAWTEAARASARGERETAPRALVEVRGHYPSSWSAANFQSVVLKDIIAMREEFKDTCTVTTSYLVRRPVDQYASYYDYYVKRAQEEEANKEANGESVTHKWGKSVHDWALTKPDLQTRELLWNERCIGQLRAAPFDHSQPWPHECLQVSDDDWSRARSMFDSFDVVGTTDRFNEFLLIVAKLVGIEDVRYVYSNAGRSVSELDKGALANTISNVTTNDVRLYEDADKALTSTIESMYGSVEKFKRDVLEPYEKATVVTDGRRYVGGKAGATPKYKWVRANDAVSSNATPVQLPMWVMPNGGGQATAYMIRDPVVMVERAAAPRAPCAKGCNFD